MQVKWSHYTNDTSITQTAHPDNCIYICYPKFSQYLVMHAGVVGVGMEPCNGSAGVYFKSEFIRAMKKVQACSTFI